MKALLLSLRLILLFSILISSPAFSQKQSHSYSLKTVITGINVPWGMVQLPDGNFLVTERAGNLYYVDIKSNKNHKVEGLPDIQSRGQGGLLDIELHPDYATNGWIYFSYSSSQGSGSGSNTAIMRAKLKGMTLVDKQQIYKATPNSRKTQHFGSRIEFDKDGFIYFSIGDRGKRDVNPQNITLDGGKIYRLHDDGRVPKDNPFINHQQAKTAIYSYGHRNPQGMEMNPVTGDIWVHEHGPKGGDEINIIKKGKNYGWPVISYGVNYSGSKFTELTKKDGMEQPIWYWVPSIAPSGMTFVTSDKYPDWQGNLIVGSLKFSQLVLCRIKEGKVFNQAILFKGIGRVRNVKQMPDGYIYVATENNKIVQIVPN
ncbi:PQQ-dependent sugar dehydrogenase [Aliikangiella sp. IMCC44359]|uniref:PQQ-dependent sugar dehydrogenase n=1 Tax=Aliikangiella sp. IMCC44359 TaxID=3459125 RepID=UPI00403AA505